MPSGSEVDAGLQLFKEILRGTGSIEVREARRLTDSREFFIAIGPKGGPSSKKSTIVLSEDFLADLPGTPGYVPAATAYARRLAGRMANTNRMNFFCRAGVPIRVETDWPRHPVANRAATYLPVSVWNLRRTGTMARCTAIVTYQQYDWDLERSSFRLEAAVINSVRRAVDGQGLKFFPMAELPSAPQELPLDLRVRPERPEAAIDRFVASKVFWLGFRQGDKRTQVWVGDDGDAEYLGVAPPSLIQTAQILEAQKMVVLDSNQQYAAAGEALLAQSGNFEVDPLSVNVGDSLREDAVGPQEWDAFICHATEDKDDFVRPLANALRERGLKVWFDEFSLELGDSLRQSIDYGLARSKFGVVILSPHFFEKHWTQQELNGLASREVGGAKVILPVWYKVGRVEVAGYSLTLADRIAVSAEQGLGAVVERIVKAIRGFGDSSREFSPDPTQHESRETDALADAILSFPRRAMQGNPRLVFAESLFCAELNETEERVARAMDVLRARGRAEHTGFPGTWHLIP